MKRISYHGKQTMGPNQIYLESHHNFTKYFFNELDSVRDWQFFKYSVKTEDSTLSRVFSENVHQNINYLCRVSSDINNNK